MVLKNVANFFGLCSLEENSSRKLTVSNPKAAEEYWEARGQREDGDQHRGWEGRQRPSLNTEKNWPHCQKKLSMQQSPAHKMAVIMSVYAEGGKVGREMAPVCLSLMLNIAKSHSKDPRQQSLVHAEQAWEWLSETREFSVLGFILQGQCYKYNSLQIFWLWFPVQNVINIAIQHPCGMLGAHVYMWTYRHTTFTKIIVT